MNPQTPQAIQSYVFILLGSLPLNRLYRWGISPSNGGERRSLRADVDENDDLLFRD